MNPIESMNLKLQQQQQRFKKTTGKSSYFFYYKFTSLVRLL